ncbi:hypothetical protein, partial [Enterobacter intestinihominis]
MRKILDVIDFLGGGPATGNQRVTGVTVHKAISGGHSFLLVSTRRLLRRADTTARRSAGNAR